MHLQRSFQQQHQQYTAGNPASEHHKVKPVQISSLGGLAISVHGKDIGVQGWENPKVYQLLSLIIAMGGSNIAVHQLCDAIWPDVEDDKRMQNFKIILWHLRQIMQSALGKDLCATQVIQLQHGKISLNADNCNLDIWQWENLRMQAQTLRLQGDQYAARENEHQAAALLVGGLLDGDDALELVGRRRLIWHDHACIWIDTTMKQWRNDTQFDYDHMMALFDVWQNLDPSSERLCMQRMRVLLDKGYTVDAMRLYYAWVELIRGKYGLRPSEQAIALFNRIKNQPALSAHRCKCLDGQG